MKVFFGTWQIINKIISNILQMKNNILYNAATREHYLENTLIKNYTYIYSIQDVHCTK